MMTAGLCGCNKCSKALTAPADQYGDDTALIDHGTPAYQQADCSLMDPREHNDLLANVRVHSDEPTACKSVNSEKYK